MPSVKVKENEPFDVALRRFKRSCEKAGLLAEVRKPRALRKADHGSQACRYCGCEASPQENVSGKPQAPAFVLRPNRLAR